MPYNKISEAPPSWKKLASTAGGKKKYSLSLSQINYISRVYDGLVARGMDKSQAAGTAIQTFRGSHKVSAGKWVKKQLKDPVMSCENQIPFEAPFTINKYWSESPTGKEDSPDEKWYIEGQVVVDKMDYQDDVISPIAMQTALPDLEQNSTVLYNHHLDEEIGKIVSYEFLGDSVRIKALISKTRPDIWQEIQEGVLRKFSIRGNADSYDLYYLPQLDTLVRYVKSLTINEISVVSVSAQADADFKWYVTSDDEPIAYHTQKAFNLSLEGGEAIMKKARKPEASPAFDIKKNADGTQAITIQVPEGFEKSSKKATPEAGDVDLGNVEKAIKVAQTNIDDILKASEQLPDDASDATKALFEKIAGAAKALKDGGLGTVEKGANPEGTKPSGDTIQIVLPNQLVKSVEAPESAPGESKTTPEKATLTEAMLADVDFQKALLGRMSKGLTMDDAVQAAHADLQKARDAAADDQTGVVKSLLDLMIQKDQGLTTVNEAVVKLAEIVSSQSTAISGLQESVNKIPVRKGLKLSEEAVATERDNLTKAMDGKEPREQLITLLSYAFEGQQAQQTM